MLIGTAGHIDHGKTTLIRALTGVNTDRLPEEQRRGISIELGFAYLVNEFANEPASRYAHPPSANSPLPGEAGAVYRDVLGFIDVPGHEKFVPTMLAGAAGIDFALLVIAADDGPMPQTREHLAILNLLGVSRGAVALSKIDRATPEQRASAEFAISQLLAGTPLQGAPVFPVAAPLGDGITQLRDHLFAVAESSRVDATQPFFRLAIDRSFSIAGAGTVVTGTVMAGRVSVGDTLSFAKKSEQRHFAVRVRSLHVNNRPAESGGRGSRCAINLAGIGSKLSHQDITRGDWLVSPELDHASQRLDVELNPLPGSEKHLRPGVELHLHHGAQHAMGKLVPLDPARGWYQIVSNTPLLACHGDRLILRDASAQQTLAGARVLDPAGPARHRARPERLAQLAALSEPDPVLRLARLLDTSPHGVDFGRFARTHNVLVTPPASAIVIGDWRFAPSHASALTRRVEATLGSYHANHPDELGLERDRLRRIAAPQLDSKLFAGWLVYWKGKGSFAQTGNAWHLPSHRVELSPAEQSLATSLLPTLADGRFDPPWVRDLAAQRQIDEAEMRQLLRKLAAQGQVFQIVRDLFYHRDVVRELGQLVMTLAGPEGVPVKAAALRDVTGLGRKRAIQILEFFDRVGYTRRIGSGQQQAHALRGDPPVE